MKIGYARVSTDDQNLDLQRRALKAAGCDLIFKDHGRSGADNGRPGLARALARLKPGDVLAVWKLDRLGRSLPHLIEILDSVGKTGAGFQTLSESIDTTTAGGKLVFHVLAAIAEFERSLISERTRAGMASARQRGIPMGRPRKLTAKQIARAKELITRRRRSRASIAAELGVDVATLRRALASPPSSE
jgi:DNA invertase Pin-like site-specific DNA recombinase